MKTSRGQFEEWFSVQKERMKSCGLGMIHIRRAHDAAWSAWQASRQCIEVELPDEEDPADCFCNVFAVDDVIYQIKQAGIKIKGA